GERFLGSFPFTTINQSNETFAVAFDTTAALPIRSGITLTATDANGNTSEFSDCVLLDGASQIRTVTSTDDPGDGVCDASCTLRDAILAVNPIPDGNVIRFAIPGAGPHTIAIT